MEISYCIKNKIVYNAIFCEKNNENLFNRENKHYADKAIVLSLYVMVAFMHGINRKTGH